MNLVDIIILCTIIIFGLIGFVRGFFKQTVVFVGELLVLILAFILKNPLGSFMCKNLPFINFNGAFEGIQSINILAYQLLAFLIIAALLGIIVSFFIVISGIIERVLKLTIILGIPSKILGAIVGIVEGFLICFIVIFILKQPLLSYNIRYIEDSKVSNFVYNHVPGLSSSVEGTGKALNEIYDLVKNKDGDYNARAVDAMLKYKVVDVKLMDDLVAQGKISGNGVEGVINKYR